MNAEKFVTEVGALWKEIGYSDEQRKGRTYQIRVEIGATLTKIIGAERAERDRMEQEATKCAEEITSISKRLGEPIPTYSTEGKTLLERLRIVQNVRADLTSQKDAREGELQGLLSTLTMTIKAIGSAGLQGEKYKSLDNLSASHIQEIRTYAADMERVRGDIVSKAQATIADIRSLCGETSEALSEQACALDGSSAVTAEQLSALNEEKSRLAALRDRRAQEIAACVGELRRISAETGSPSPLEVERFAEDVRILSADNVKRCRVELARQQEALMGRIKGEIRDTIDALKAVWDDIGYEKRTVDAHGANFDTKTPEGLRTLLGYYKSQLTMFIGLKELTDQIIELIESRNEILREWEHLNSDEVKPRLIGRTAEASKLRIEYTRAQGKLTKIPRIEGLLLDKLSEWRDRTDTRFFYDGVDYLEKIQEDGVARQKDPIYKYTKAATPAVRRRRRLSKTPQGDGGAAASGGEPTAPATAVLQEKTTPAHPKQLTNRQFTATYTAPVTQKQQQQKGIGQKNGLVTTLVTPGLKGAIMKEPKTTGNAAAAKAGNNKRGADLNGMPRQKLFGAGGGGAKGLGKKKKSVKRKSIRNLETHKPLKKSRRLK